jgi:Putative Flp pilus-assembly TadE/G-like
MRLRSEAGQAAALTAVFMTVLLGSCAAVLDVGAWFREDRDTQRIADAAALAGAQALPDDPGTAQGLAIEYADKNGGGLTAGDIEFSMTAMPSDTIKTTVERPAPGFFAKLFGIDSVTVGSTAKARAGVPSEAAYAAPFAVDERHPLLQCKPKVCFNEDTRLDLDKVGPGNFKILNLHNEKGGSGPGILAGWILDGFEESMPLGWYWGDPGAKMNSSQVKEAMDQRIGTEVLFPVYRRVEDQGANFRYEIIGWVGVYVTGYQFKGSKEGWIDGRFTRVIWEGLTPVGSSPASDFGVRVVSLID